MPRSHTDIRFGLLPLLARLLLIVALVIALTGKIPAWSIAMAVPVCVCLALGVWSRPAATALLVYVGIVTLTRHDFTTLGVMGGLLMIAAFGAGTWSLDWARFQRRARPRPASPSYERA